jgi:hypothetical protein
MPAMRSHQTSGSRIENILSYAYSKKKKKSACLQNRGMKSNTMISVKQE